MVIRRRSRDSLAAVSGLNQLIKAAGQLKQLRRSGWVKKAGIRSAESVADHSYRMAVLGIILADESGLDESKVIRMCIIHDLAESVLGDKMPEEKRSKSSHRLEELRVLRKMIEPLTPELKEKLRADIDELMMEKSSEARFVWEIDKLEMGLQRIDYLAAGHDQERLARFDTRKILSKRLAYILDRYERFLKVEGSAKLP